MSVTSLQQVGNFRIYREATGKRFWWILGIRWQSPWLGHHSDRLCVYGGMWLTSWPLYYADKPADKWPQAEHSSLLLTSQSWFDKTVTYKFLPICFDTTGILTDATVPPHDVISRKSWPIALSFQIHRISNTPPVGSMHGYSMRGQTVNSVLVVECLDMAEIDNCDVY